MGLFERILWGSAIAYFAVAAYGNFTNLLTSDSTCTDNHEITTEQLDDIAADVRWLVAKEGDK